MQDRVQSRGTRAARMLLSASVVVALIGLVATAYGAVDPNAPAKPAQPLVSPADAFPIEHRRIHYTGDIWMCVSNDGSIGTNSGAVLPDAEDLRILKINYGPSFEFPGGSQVDYLFNGSLWIGGIVGTDTLVSASKSSASGDAFEWNGYTQIVAGAQPGYPGECDTIQRQLGQTYTAVFSDTLVLPNTNDPKGRLHLPLGLEVVQTTHQSADNFTRRFIIYDYKVTNISDRPIQQMWFGIFLDNDIFWENVSGCSEAATIDDLSGILTTWPNPVNPIYTDSLMVAWAIDNDGDACGSPRFPRVSARGAMGMRVLRGPTPESRVNFNWFTTNFGNLDWGPRLASDQYNFGSGGTGLPPGDAPTYHVMSNGEIDYSQPFAAIDFRPEWARPPIAAADNVANGLDSRVCLSTGPKPTLRPGETVPFTIAFVAGGNIHREPSNQLDTQNPQAFIDRLDFRDLATNAWWAGFVWDNHGFDTNPDDANEYKGEFYRPVIGDTVFYTGDGCPDMAGPAPPPSPDSANSDLQLLSRPGELIMRWTGRTIETSVDPLLRNVDFEGFKVYVAERNSFQDQPTSDDYSLIASWDKEDYRRYTYNPSNGFWDLNSDPLTNDGWRAVFGDPSFDGSDFPGPSLANCYTYADTLSDGSVVNRCAYFAPQDVNHANEYLVAGQVEQNLIQRVEVRDTVIDDVPFHYGVYELKLDGLLQSRHYFLTLTAFDYGDPFSNLEPLETAKGGIASRLAGIPIYSADVVEDYTARGGAFADSVRVSVYPNPYKIGFEDASGRLTSYFEQGFEGDQGQSELNEQDRRIHFINVPDTCEINIYTLDGDLVRTLTHPDVNLSGYSSKVSWDLISRNTQAVTSGIYLYRVDSRLGSQVGKIVIIK